MVEIDQTDPLSHKPVVEPKRFGYYVDVVI